MVHQLSTTATVYVAVSIGTAVLTLAMMYWVSQSQRGVRGYQSFLATLAIGGLVWQPLVIAHVVSTNPTFERLAVVAELGVGIAAGVAWTVFVARYTGTNYHRRRSVQAYYVLLLGSYLLLAVTTPFHDLLFRDIVLYDQPFSFAGPVRGPAYFGILLFDWAMVGASVYVLLSFLSATRRGDRLHTALLTVGVSSIGLLNTLSILGWTPVASFEHASYGAFPFILFTTIGAFRQQLLEIEPVARTTLVESLTDPILVVDVDHRITDFNEESLRITPALADSLGEPLETVWPELADGVTFPDGARDVTDDVTLGTANGTRHYSVQVTPVLGQTGETSIGYALLLRDVTELEASRRELQRQNEQLDRVASTVSHDLRNPLSVASGSLELLATELEDDEDAREYLERTRDAHDRIEEIVEDVLAIAREGQTIEETEPLGLQAVAEDAWANVDTDGGQLVVWTEATVHADRSRLLSIFENLFRNAIEHGPSGVTVTVDGTADGFVVQDTGPGIPADEADDVFEYGYTTAEDGTGLGLSIVETLAEAHGWQVAIDHDYDDGTKFVFSGVQVDSRMTAGAADDAGSTPATDR